MLNVPISSLMTTSLSSIHADLRGIGKKAAETLMDILEDNEVKNDNIIFPMKYVERETIIVPKET
ncbi:substrate-binding domain-containing protein [Salibacterium aidingense]|uniref:substrate-binding domain-containing protein n=1 Tax=Salibacterium aidingense TaxID=384933 RepID=UPI003BBA1D55